MAELRQCDGCGITSPQNHLHIANHWIEVTVDPIAKRHRYFSTAKRFLFCQKCFGVEGVPPCRSWLSRVCSAAFKRFRLKGWQEPLFGQQGDLSASHEMTAK